jgi:hypothetical protein
MLSHLHTVEGSAFMRGKFRGDENQINKRHTEFPKAILTSLHKIGNSPDGTRNCEICIFTSLARHEAHSSSSYIQHLTSATTNNKSNSHPVSTYLLYTW